MIDVLMSRSMDNIDGQAYFWLHLQSKHPVYLCYQFIVREVSYYVP